MTEPGALRIGGEGSGSLGRDLARGRRASRGDEIAGGIKTPPRLTDADVFADRDKDDKPSNEAGERSAEKAQE